MMKRAMWTAVGCAAMLGIGSVAMAQQSGLVNVSLKNVADNIAKNINVDVSQIPVAVQVPVDDLLVEPWFRKSS